MVRNTKAFSYLLLAVLFLGACTTTYRADVTRFHELTGPRGETFIVVAKSEEKKGSLELKSYSAIVSDYLRTVGFVPAGTGTPDVIVKIDYAVSPPLERTRRETYPGPFFGGFYYYGGSYYAGLPYYYYPFYDHPYYSPFGYRSFGFGYGSGFGYYPYERSYIVYERAFEMTIERNGGGMLFEGLVKSVGREKDMTKIMPVLVEAMFTNFPGESGTTERVKIKSDKGDGY